MVYDKTTFPIQSYNDPIWNQKIPLKDFTKNPKLYLLDSKEWKKMKA